jgi:hypothetical protein
MPHIANLADDCDCCCSDDPFANAIGCAPHPPPNQTTNTDVIKPIPPSTSIQLCPPTLTVDCKNKRVGINTLTPTTTLDVNGPAKFGNVYYLTGSSSTLKTIHTISQTELSLLANSSMNGDLTLYINNNLYVNVTMGAVVKAGGTILQTLIYQRVGNFISVDMTYSGNTISITTNPASTINWIFRGI